MSKFLPSEIVSARAGAICFLSTTTAINNSAFNYLGSESAGIVLYREQNYGKDAYWILLENNRRVLIESKNLKRKHEKSKYL